jgi:hypothetical protein
MSEIVQQLGSPAWWFSSVVVAIVAGVVANFVYDRDARAERRSQHIPVEGTQGAGSIGGAPVTLLLAGASALFGLG